MYTDMQGHYNHVKKDIQVDFHGKHARYLYLTVMDTDTFESNHYMKTIFYLKLELIYVTKRIETSLTTFCVYRTYVSTLVICVDRRQDSYVDILVFYICSLFYNNSSNKISRHIIVYMYIRITLSIPQMCKFCLLIGYCKSSISNSMK